MYGIEVRCCVSYSNSYYVTNKLASGKLLACRATQHNLHALVGPSTWNVGFLAHGGSGAVCCAHCRYPQQTLTPSPLNSSCSYLQIASKNKHAVLAAFSPSLLPHASPSGDVHWFPAQSITALPYLPTGSPRYLAAGRVGGGRQKGKSSRCSSGYHANSGGSAVRAASYGNKDDASYDIF